MINPLGYSHKIFHLMLLDAAYPSRLLKPYVTKFVHHHIIYVHDRPLSCHDTPFANVLL